VAGHQFKPRPSSPKLHYYNNIQKMDDRRLRDSFLTGRITAGGCILSLQLLEAGIMEHPRRHPSALYRTSVSAGWTLALLASALLNPMVSTYAGPIIAKQNTSSGPEIAPQARSIEVRAVASTDVSDARSIAPTAMDLTHEPNAQTPIGSRADEPKMTSLEAPSVATANSVAADPARFVASDDVSSVKILDECLVPEVCIDRFLWALYQRTPKVDSIKIFERRKLTIRKRSKRITVSKTFSKRVDQDFSWKDPKAAEKAGMTLMQYVVGGMDRNFKLKLFHALLAAEQDGLSPGITSAFRDDYRQSIASGMKAATDRSYHGGSFRGGYGCGLAADVVSVKGEDRAERRISTGKLWEWIDRRGKDFGIGRPYLNKDAPHVGPIDGKEYAVHRSNIKEQRAESHAGKHKRLAVHEDRSTTKRSEAPRLAKLKTM
jgi:hypothetical protein